MSVQPGASGRPIWLDDEPWLQELLLWFVARLDGTRSRAITRRINERTVPALYDFQVDTEGRWLLIEQELVSRWQVFVLTPSRGLAPHQQPYENAQLRLRPEAEELLRRWLDRPRIDPDRAAWHAAVEKHANAFVDQGRALLRQRLVLPGYSGEQLVAGLAAVGPLLESNLSLRELSARCLLGNSKVLDQRQDLLRQLFGDRADTIRPRPLLLSAWAPPGFSRLLIIENQDSFLHLVDQAPTRTALLYSGGFRASASRVTSNDTRFAFLPGSDARHFHAHWRQPPAGSFFWGDLDYAGMDILRGLRLALPELEAWQAGYQPMLTALLAGQGHAPEQAGKDRQLDPGRSGCAYADDFLLPALRTTGRFLDQEGFHPASPEQLSSSACPAADP